jgi:hypothetical protein
MKAPQKPPPAKLNESQDTALEYCGAIEAEADHDEAVAMLKALGRSLDWEKGVPFAVERAHRNLTVDVLILPRKWWK